MAVRDQFRAALIDGDVDLIVGMWAKFFPGQPQPGSWYEAQVQMHMARTNAESVPVKYRAYSHHWLLERDLPSLLPNELKPKAEQYKPNVTSGVGFAWGSGSKILMPAKNQIQKVVGDRIEELAADGKLGDTDLVRNEMVLAKNRELHSLFGNIGALKKRKAA